MSLQRTRIDVGRRLRVLQGKIADTGDAMFAAYSAGRVGVAHGEAYELIQLVMEADDLLAALLTPADGPSPAAPNSRSAESARIPVQRGGDFA